mmetsp:Transcript_43234/g.69093  ORF Transcript_43234/g.69093 Transcript_43234/m.69093 type:complete len:1036 (+) Transcript_43234:78-3185(+)
MHDIHGTANHQLGTPSVSLRYEVAQPRQASAAPSLASESESIISDCVFAVSVFSLTALVAYVVLSGATLPGTPPVGTISPLLAEFAGTYILVFTVSCCCISGSPSWNPTAIAAVLMAMIYATGPISGGNLNPAVSIALCLCDKMTPETTAQYCLAQILGGILATLTTCLTISPIPNAVGPVAPFAWGFAALAEVIFTTMLCFVVLNCAASKRNNSPDDSNQFFGLAIGFVVIAGGYPCGNISGAHFNPAVSLGLEMVTGAGLGWGFVWACCQCLASVIACALFKLLRPEEQDRSVDLESYQTPLLGCCVAEFAGAFVLVLTVGLNLVTASGATAWSAAATLTSMIYSLGDVSGAHFNPAVSLAVLASGREKCSIGRAGCYMMSQILGACCAGVLYTCFHIAGPTADTAFPLASGKNHRKLKASLGEMLFTSMLAYAVLATATTTKPGNQKSRQNFYFAFCIGACVMVGGTSLGTVSGGELNPAVSLGVVAANYLFGVVVPEHAETTRLEASYFPLFELFGGLIAAMIFRLTHHTEYGSNGQLTTHSASEQPQPHIVSKCFAELVGTFFLVLTVGFVSLAGTATWNPLAIALVLMVMIYCTGSVSGGNLNPAVSLALVLCKQLELGQMCLYWLMQIIGGILAGCTFCFIFDNGVAVAPGHGYTWDVAVIAEILYTAMLCFVVASCVCSKANNPEADGNQFYGMAIGFVIVAGGYAAGSISGACFNPAVSLGLSSSRVLFNGGSIWMNGLLWSGFQLIGAGIAAVFFRVMRPQDVDDINSPSTPDREASLMIKCLSEFLGVFTLTMTVGLNIISKSPATALSAAGALMSMIYSLGYISGAHLNPAVTLAVVLSGRGKCEPHVGVVYALVQILAALLAGHFYAGFHVAGPNKHESFILAPGKGYSLGVAGMSELFFTFVLAYTVLAVATVTPTMLKQTKQCFYSGLAIASCVIAGGFAIGGISGGELNPAVSLGISVANIATNASGHRSALVNFFPFSMWELCGAIIAAIVFRATHSSEYIEPSVEKIPDAIKITRKA